MHRMFYFKRYLLYNKYPKMLVFNDSFNLFQRFLIEYSARHNLNLVIAEDYDLYLIYLFFQFKQQKMGGVNSTANQTLDESGVTWCRFDGKDYSESGFHVSFFVSSYAIPLVLIIFLYIGMLRRLWNPGSIGNKISKESLRNKRRVTK